MEAVYRKKERKKESKEKARYNVCTMNVEIMANNYYMSLRVHIGVYIHIPMS